MFSPRAPPHTAATHITVKIIRIPYIVSSFPSQIRIQTPQPSPAHSISATSRKPAIADR
jgi:hypothetical protein